MRHYLILSRSKILNVIEFFNVKLENRFSTDVCGRFKFFVLV